MHKIKDLFEEEVLMMREILYLMLQEENALLAGNLQLHKEFLHRRSQLNRKLLPIRKARKELLGELIFPEQEEESIPEDFSEEGCELTSLKEQFFELMRKILQQQTHNRFLIRTMKQGGSLPKLQVKPEREEKKQLKTLEEGEDLIA